MWVCLNHSIKPDFRYTLLVNMYFLAITVPDVSLNTIAIYACGTGDLLPTHPAPPWPKSGENFCLETCWEAGGEPGAMDNRKASREQSMCLWQSYWLEEVMRGEETVEDYGTTMGWGLWGQVAHVAVEAFGEHPGLDILVLVTCSQAGFTQSFVLPQPVSRHHCSAALK